MQSIPGLQIMSYWFFCYEIILLGGKIPLGHSVLHEQIMVPGADSEEMTAKKISLKSMKGGENLNSHPSFHSYQTSTLSKMKQHKKITPWTILKHINRKTKISRDEIPRKK